MQIISNYAIELDRQQLRCAPLLAATHGER